MDTFITRAGMHQSGIDDPAVNCLADELIFETCSVCFTLPEAPRMLKAVLIRQNRDCF